jgi:hypothetical protein
MDRTGLFFFSGRNPIDNSTLIGDPFKNLPFISSQANRASCRVRTIKNP